MFRWVEKKRREKRLSGKNRGGSHTFFFFFLSMKKMSENCITSQNCPLGTLPQTTILPLYVCDSAIVFSIIIGLYFADLLRLQSHSSLQIYFLLPIWWDLYVVLGFACNNNVNNMYCHCLHCLWFTIFLLKVSVIKLLEAFSWFPNSFF